LQRQNDPISTKLRAAYLVVPSSMRDKREPERISDRHDPAASCGRANWLVIARSAGFAPSCVTVFKKECNKTTSEQFYSK